MSYLFLEKVKKYQRSNVQKLVVGGGGGETEKKVERRTFYWGSIKSIVIYITMSIDFPNL